MKYFIVVWMFGPKVGWCRRHNTNHQENTMGQVLHGGTTTTAVLRRTIQNSQESLNRLASRYNFNVKLKSN